jgi:hypothetical protein
MRLLRKSNHRGHPPVHDQQGATQREHQSRASDYHPRFLLSGRICDRRSGGIGRFGRHGAGRREEGGATMEVLFLGLAGYRI